MKNKIVKKLFSTIATSIILFGIGLIIWFFNKESKMSLQNILFWIGAIPIAIFSVGLIGNYTGALNPSSRFDRPLIEQSLKDRTQHGKMDFKARAASGLNWIIAGILIWVVSYMV